MHNALKTMVILMFHLMFNSKYLIFLQKISLRYYILLLNVLIFDQTEFNDIMPLQLLIQSNINLSNRIFILLLENRVKRGNSSHFFHLPKKNSSNNFFQNIIIANESYGNELDACPIKILQLQGVFF